MKPATIKRLRDALGAARLIESHTHGLSQEAYEADPWLRSAAERQFEIIGEAFNNARRLDPDLEVAVPDLHGWISMRHFIAHLYDNVDNHVLWDTIQRDIPELINRLEALLTDR
jgi:uncharacterized protein with HEPN domain